MMMKSIGFDMDTKTGLSTRLEEAMARLALAIEDMEESKREDDHKKDVGAQWKEIAKVTDRYTHLTINDIFI